MANQNRNRQGGRGGNPGQQRQQPKKPRISIEWGALGSGRRLSITLAVSGSDGKPITGAEVRLYINGAQFEHKKTDTSGVACFAVAVSDEMHSMQISGAVNCSGQTWAITPQEWLEAETPVAKILVVHEYEAVSNVWAFGLHAKDGNQTLALPATVVLQSHGQVKAWLMSDPGATQCGTTLQLAVAESGDLLMVEPQDKLARLTLALPGGVSVKGPYTLEKKVLPAANTITFQPQGNRYTGTVTFDVTTSLVADATKPLAAEFELWCVSTQDGNRITMTGDCGGQSFVSTYSVTFTTGNDGKASVTVSLPLGMRGRIHCKLVGGPESAKSHYLKNM